MCGHCGCGESTKATILDLQTGASTVINHDLSEPHEHVHADGTRHSHAHEQHHEHVERPGHSVIELEARILAKNDLLAMNLFIVEGDQATANDAERIRAAGAPVVQVNTGTGCHLEADMVERGLRELKPAPGSVVMIENVGNLICPAMFDLGEWAKIVMLSVTEGEDKPLKYPHMFRAASVMILSKVDLLPHLEFDMEAAIANARLVNPDIVILCLSVRTGEGLDGWYRWVRQELVLAGNGF
jgi:hydrogenase nickel incorporation protein HypB